MVQFLLQHTSCKLFSCAVTVHFDLSIDEQVYSSFVFWMLWCKHVLQLHCSQTFILFFRNWKTFFEGFEWTFNHQRSHRRAFYQNLSFPRMQEKQLRSRFLIYFNSICIFLYSTITLHYNSVKNINSLELIKFCLAITL